MGHFQRSSSRMSVQFFFKVLVYYNCYQSFKCSAKLFSSTKVHKSLYFSVLNYALVPPSMVHSKFHMPEDWQSCIQSQLEIKGFIAANVLQQESGTVMSISIDVISSTESQRMYFIARMTVLADTKWNLKWNGARKVMSLKITRNEYK